MTARSASLLATRYGKLLLLLLCAVQFLDVVDSSIMNVALPVVWFPAMSVASQRNSVVVVTTKLWPGSRGPVESQSVDVLLGFDPSVVYRITAGSVTYLNVVVIGVLDERAPVMTTSGPLSSFE